jgi:hypothetical protein
VILAFETATAESYAVSWASLDAATSSDGLDRAASWVEHYRELGIREIVTGLVVLHRRIGRTWVGAEEVASAGWEAGEHLARVFAGRDLLERLGADSGLEACALSLAPGVRLVQTWLPGHRLERARLAFRDGLGLSGAITPPGVAEILGALDGRRTLAQAATVSGVDPGELEKGIGSIRALIERGYLAQRSVPHSTARTKPA